MSDEWGPCADDRMSAVDIDSTYRLILTKRMYDWHLWIMDAVAIRHVSEFGQVLHPEDLERREDAQRYAEYIFSQWKAGTW